jgi:energy-coupling factor transporter transmembrane protein EcfT
MGFDLSRDWAEYLALLLLFLGLLFSLIITNPFFKIIIIFLAGFMLMNFAYIDRKEKKVPFYLVLIFFVFGFILFSYKLNRFILVMDFIVSLIIGNYFIKYLESKKFEPLKRFSGFELLFSKKK